MNNKVLSNNKWLDKFADLVAKIQHLTNISYVDCETCNYENQMSNLVFANSSYEILSVLIKSACGHDVAQGVSFSRMVNDNGSDFELLGEGITECWVHKAKPCTHHLDESKAFVCYQCDNLKSKIMRIDNVNVCSLKCLKDYLNAQVK
ncbi:MULTISPECIES: hypothetical protein [Spiroplasma]|uniref:hypothetical protein n=1 Tax=Spiroplasma TaxID=2132 RepID=UPI0018DD92EF|nr:MULTISPECIES: hypothetical protein [Spiroplasma]MBH8623036.1 hypothetical protein [Spiroplasma sp. hyd1]UNF62515.1 hypothetical protein MNU24_03400 [Spiroplasma poulsonii]